MLGHPQVQAAADLLITHEYNMSQGAEAFDAALSKKAGKVFLYPQEDCPRPGPSETVAQLAEQYGPRNPTDDRRELLAVLLTG